MAFYGNNASLFNQKGKNEEKHTHTNIQINK